jgi:hypothetical protein
MIKSMRFLWLTFIDDVSGKGLADATFKFLEKSKLVLKQCRGNDYDSAADMMGKRVT